MNSRLFMLKPETIPLYKRIPYSQLKANQPARSRDFDIPVYALNYPKSLMYGETDDDQPKAYLYHERGSVVDLRKYHECVWMEGDPIVFWDDALVIPVVIGNIRSIDFSKGDIDTFYLNVLINPDEVIHGADNRYMALMEGLAPLWRPEQSWWEFRVNMTTSLAQSVHMNLLHFGEDGEMALINPRYHTEGRKEYHSFTWYPAFTYQYANYPNEQYALRELVRFVQKLNDASPTHGGWALGSNVVVGKDYNIELQLSYTDESDAGNRDVTVKVSLIHIKEGKYVWESETYEWEECDFDHDTLWAEEVIRQQLEGVLNDITIVTPEEEL